LPIRKSRSACNVTAKIDPIGFGLENFNAAGKWREVDHDPKTEKDWPINPGGQFTTAPRSKPTLTSAIKSPPRAKASPEASAEALIEYALGRPYGFTDEDLARTIVQLSKTKDFAIREFYPRTRQKRRISQKVAAPKLMQLRLRLW